MTTISTVTGVTCSQAREMISARIDGEIDENDEFALDRHNATCGDCHAYEQDAYALRRALRIRAAGSDAVAPTDGSPKVNVAGSLRAVTVLRWVLFVVGGTLVVLNLSSVISPDGTAASHLSRHDGIFGTALGVGMLAVAAKPHRAIGLVPVTSAVAILMAVAATTDLVNGSANLLSEAVHVVEFLGLICLWVISGGPSRLPQHVETLTRRLPAIFASSPAPSLDGPKR